MMEISSAENRYISRMRELNHFITNDFPGPEFYVPLIDQDFAPEHTSLPSTPHSLEGFDKELEHLYDFISDQETNADSMRRSIESAKLIIANLAGSLVIGKTMSYQDFVEATMGVRPEMVTDEELDAQKELIDERLSSMGYRYDEAHRERFAKDPNHAIPEEEIEPIVRDLIGAVEKDLDEAIGSDRLERLARPRLDIENIEDLYQGFFGIDGQGQEFIRANTNPLLQMSVLQYRVMLGHEYAHWSSTGTKRRGISTGLISPDAGIFATFSPRYPLEEIIARTVEEYMLSKKAANGDAYAQYLYASMGYDIDVNNNMMIMANSGHNKEEVVKYGRYHLPFDEPEKTEKNVDMYFDDLLYKTVFAVDRHALRVGRRIASIREVDRKSMLEKLSLKSLPNEELLAGRIAVAAA